MANVSRILGSRKKIARRVDPNRKSKKARHNMYDRQWRNARLAFLHDNPLCVECARNGIIKEAEHVDHKIPHKGNPELFWKLSNWQSLCAACHGRKTVLEDGGFGK